MTGQFLRWIQRLLFVAGFAILGYCGANWMNSNLRQREGNRELDRALNYKPRRNPAVTESENLLPENPVLPGELIGKVEVPRLHLSAVVFQGTESTVLDRGVGHLVGSALPGHAGNVVLAAHRDTFFRSLRDIHKGDTVSVTTQSGPRTYQVDSTEIVDPAQTSVLDPTVKPTLTLITCYPFYFIGHAPKRFIVRARDTDDRDLEDQSAQAGASAEIAGIPAPGLEEKKEMARNALSQEQAPSHLTAEETENLTYVFKASQ